MTYSHLSLIRAFFEDQRAILSKFLRTYPAHDEFLTGVPKSGALMVGKEKWNFAKHGRGVRFVCESSEKVVDVHKFFAGVECPIDAWRFLQYAETLGVEFGSRGEVENMLDSLVASGELEATAFPGVYAMR